MGRGSHLFPGAGDRPQSPPAHFPGTDLEGMRDRGLRDGGDPSHPPKTHLHPPKLHPQPQNHSPKNLLPSPASHPKTSPGKLNVNSSFEPQILNSSPHTKSHSSPPKSSPLTPKPSQVDVKDEQKWPNLLFLPLKPPPQFLTKLPHFRGRVGAPNLSPFHPQNPNFSPQTAPPQPGLSVPMWWGPGWPGGCGPPPMGG